MSHSIVNGNLAGFSNLGYGFSFSEFWMYHATSFWPTEFLQRNQQIALWGFPCVQLLSSLLLPLELCPSCYFEFVMSWCGSEFIFFGTLCDSRTRISVSFLIWGNFLVIISSNTFFIPFSLFSGTLTMWMLVCLTLYQRALKLFSHKKICFFFFFKIFWLGDYHCSTSMSLMRSSVSICYSFLLVCFLFQLLNSTFLIRYLFSSILLKCSLSASESFL